MSFNPNLVVSHEVNKAFQSNNFPRWFYYYNLNNDTLEDDYIPYDDAYNYKYGNNAIFEIISSDSRTVGLKKLEIDHSTRTTELTSLELENGSSVVVDYNALANKPQVNGVSLTGNKTASDLGINVPTKVSELDNDSDFASKSYVATEITGTFSIDTDTTSTFINLTIVEALSLSITKVEPGMQVILQLVQDGTGGGTVDWSSDFRFPGGVKPITSTAPNAKDIFTFICSEENKLDCVNAVFNVAV